MTTTEAVPLAPVLRHVSAGTRSATLVAGGYFESATGVDEFSRNTFALATRIGRAVSRLHRRNKVRYDVIHNDLGMACGTDVCALPARPSDGEVDLAPLTASAARSRIDFTVTRERTLRNRANRSMKDWLKDPTLDRRFVRDGDDIYFRSRSYERVLAGVAREHYVIPRCPLIMGEYYALQFARLREFTACGHRYVVDISSFADRDKVLKGAEIYLRTAGTPAETIVLVFTDSVCEQLVAMPVTADDF